MPFWWITVARTLFYVPEEFCFTRLNLLAKTFTQLSIEEMGFWALLGSAFTFTVIVIKVKIIWAHLSNALTPTYLTIECLTLRTFLWFTKTTTLFKIKTFICIWTFLDFAFTFAFFKVPDLGCRTFLG